MKMTNFNSFSRSVLIILVVISAYSCAFATVAENKQSIIFYENINCKGRNFTFEDSNFDLFQHWVTNSTSYYVNGMWEVHMQSTVNPQNTIRILWHSTGSCQWTEATSKVVRIERYGPSMLDTPEITLFGDQNFKGIRIPANETGLSFARPIMTQSFMFTGVHEWTIFERVNFDGESLCLKATDEVKKVGYGFTYNWGQNILMGSMTYGCSIEESSTEHSSTNDSSSVKSSTDDSSTEKSSTLSNSQSSVRSNALWIPSLALAIWCSVLKM